MLCLPFWISWTRLALLSSVAAVLLILQGCCSSSSTPEVPPLPVLKSLQRAELEGSPGLWMSDSDAGTLAAWIYSVTGVSGL
jgi:hypothetical protein